MLMNPKDNNLIWTGPDVLAATGGEPLCGDGLFRFTGVSIDSRTIDPGQLFVAIKGKRHDGHEYITDVLAAGVSGFIVERTCPASAVARIKTAGGLCLAVEDTIRALGALARFRRRKAGLPVVAITGSNGKTSTKEMTARVLEQRYDVLATAGNFNNEIGLPLTLLRLAASHEAAVLELGMNAPGEIARLTAICEPNIGVVLNVGEGHLAGLGGIEEVARAKGELIEAMGAAGTAVLNADDPRVLKMAERATGRVVTFGQNGHGDVRGLDYRQDGGTCLFDMVFAGEGDRLSVRLNGCGRHLVSNALAAAAAGKLLDVPPAAIKEGLEKFVPVAGRLTIIPTRSGFWVVDDTYNANPASMRAAMAAVASLKGDGRGLLVLGDMLELGQRAAELHREIGRRAAESGAALLFVVGDFAPVVAEGAVGAGMDRERITAGSKAEIIAALTSAVRPGDWVLSKGSRAMAMETVTAAVVAAGGGAVTAPGR